MTIEELRAKVSGELRDSLDEMWEAFSDAQGGAEIEDFVEHLRERGLLSELFEGRLPEKPSEPAPVPGATARKERYEVGRLLGKGAMGEVFLAREGALRRKVALKSLEPGLVKKGDFVLRFETEAQITAQLDHPSIVPIYGMEFDAKGVPSYAMKLVSGKTLEDILDETRAFYEAGGRPDVAHSLPALLELFLQVCAAVQYAHSRGVIHRDLKPENIMVGEFHEVIVMDWGIARVVGGVEPELMVELAPESGTNTQLGMAIGTPAYMSPEQASGDTDELTHKSDLYTLGVILFELVSLRRAVTGNSSIKVAVKASQGITEPLEHVFGDQIPRELRAIIQKAMQLEPEDRYADVRAMSDDIRRYLRDEEVLAEPDNAQQRAARWVGRHRSMVLAGGLALVLLFFVGLVTVVGGALAALEATRVAARERNERFGEIYGEVTSQAHEIDVEFLRYQGLLTGIATAAELVLAQPPTEQTLYLAADFQGENKPPDLKYARVYDADVSLGFPDLVVAPKVELDKVQPQLHQLASLGPELKKALLASQSPDSVARPDNQQRALLGATGVPLARAYVGLETGAQVSFPGIGAYAADYDPRNQGWYHRARGKHGPVWGSSYVDKSGMGLLVPCTMALYNGEGKVQGVAGVEITIKTLVSAMLDPPDMGAAVEAYLVSSYGNIVVQSSNKDEVPTEDREAVSFEHTDLVLGSETGLTERGEDLIAWSRLAAIDWTYVVVGRTEPLLDAGRE